MKPLLKPVKQNICANKKFLIIVHYVAQLSTIFYSRTNVKTEYWFVKKVE